MWCDLLWVRGRLPRELFVEIMPMETSSALSRSLGFGAYATEGTWIHDVVIDGLACLVESRVALSRISEFPPMLPFTRPRMCIVSYVMWRERFAERLCGLFLQLRGITYVCR